MVIVYAVMFKDKLLLKQFKDLKSIFTVPCINFREGLVRSTLNPSAILFFQGNILLPSIFDQKFKYFGFLLYTQRKKF